MKKRNNNGVFYVVISLIACLAVGSIALGYVASQNVNVNGDYNYYEAEGQSSEEPLIGAVSGPDYYWDYFNFNDLTTYVKSGSFTDATTTVFAIQNPFNATSTVDLSNLNVNNGTSTMKFVVTTSTNQYWNSSVSDGTLINSPVMATSTKKFFTNGATLGPDGSPGSGSQQKIVVGPTEWIIGKVASCNAEGTALTALDTAFTGPINTFSGDYSIRFLR